MYHAVRFPQMYCISILLGLTAKSDNEPGNSELERDFRQRALVPPGTDPRPRITSLLRSPRPPPREPHSPNKPNDKTQNHRNAIHRPVLGTGFHLYLLGQPDPDRGVIVPTFFPEFSEGSVDVYGG
jgi:hypothetical protein